MVLSNKQFVYHCLIYKLMIYKVFISVLSGTVTAPKSWDLFPLSLWSLGPREWLLWLTPGGTAPL